MRRPVILALLFALGLGASWLLSRTERGGAPRPTDPDVRVGEAGSAPSASLADPPAVLEASGDPRLRREAAALVRSGPARAARGKAWLVVRVGARETGRPIPGVHMQLDEKHAHKFGFAPGAEYSSSSGRIDCACPMTDASGRIELEALSGVEYGLLVNVLATVHARRETFMVEPLAEGERREVELRLETRDDLRWFGRVLDDATGAPLAGVSAEWVAGGPLGVRGRAVSAADGVLGLDFASWEATRVEVDVPGYLPVSFELERGHESPESACPARLLRPGTLEVRVRDGQGAPRAQVRVEVVSLESQVESRLPGFELERSTDQDGACTFEGLAPRVNLSVAVRPGIGRTQRQNVILAPGESRALAFELGNGCTVQGLAMDEQGGPLAELDLWRLAVGELPALRELAHEGAVVDKARTDERGRFVFEKVPEGEWWIGPAPTPRVARVAPLATRVTVRAGEAWLKLTLVCSAPLYIQGRVLSSEGRGEHASVTAWQAGTRVSTQSRDDGRFYVGPLASGVWLLQARPDFFDSFPPGIVLDLDAPSPVARAVAGESDVLLRLQSGADVNGIVLDERGTPVPGAEVFLAPDEHGFGPTTTSDEDGFFSLGAQVPGWVHLCARAGASFAVLGPVAVERDHTPRRLELCLTTGAELRLRLASEARTGLEVRVSCNGVPLVVDGLSPGTEVQRTLPPGPAVVQLILRARDEGIEILEERPVTLHVGETSLVELAGAPPAAPR